MPATDQQLSAICTNCGLCCDGTLYFVAPLSKAECDNLIPVLEVRTEANGDTVLKQPCKALAGSCCTIYDSRPQICRGYRCGVLESVIDGELQPERAVQIVSEVRALARTVEAVLATYEPSPEKITLSQRLDDFHRRLQQLAPEQRPPVNTSMLLAAGTLKIMLAKHFKVVEFGSANPDTSRAAADERTP